MSVEMTPRFERLLDAATRGYRQSGRFAWHFARGKLRHDPLFLSVMRRGLFPDNGRLLDIGCGQGLLLALLSAARREYASGQWPEDWPAPPRHLEMRGIEMNRRRVEIAHRALDALDMPAQIECGDARAAVFPESSVIALVDVLLYLEPEAQNRVLKRAVDALLPKGLLMLREADRQSGMRFHLTHLTERLLETARGHFGQQLHYRTADEWRSTLEGLGLEVEMQPMSAGTLFCNMLLLGRMPCSAQ
ncbi:MAG: methyltransferase domain-containing protein [Burkholderiales bacterium]